MPDGERRPFPFLPLPEAEPAERARARGGGSGIARWGHDQQVARVRPQLQRLQDAFARRSLELRDELSGVEPELALVIETAGSIGRFHKAVANIPGLEWLAEEFEPEMEAGEDFYQVGKEEEPFGGTLYLVMSDQSALQDLLSLWRRYEEDENVRLARGLNPWREAFKHVRQIRPWGPEDRLRWVLEDWKDRLEWEPSTVRAQVELWYRARHEAREGQLRELEVRLRRSGGRLIGQSVVVPEIAYHACVTEVPREKVAEIVAGEEVELVRTESVMFFRPVGQIAVPIGAEEAADGIDGAEETAPDELEPVVAVLDGLPLEGHELLRGRLRIDDPDGWAAETPAAQRHHGTAMASLVVRGDLELTGGQEPARRPVYLRPVLRPIDLGPLGVREQIPEEVLEVDLLHRAVRRILVGEGGEEPTAPEALVVSLSVGDPSRPFDRQISPMARLLDWLAWEHGLLFVVSAGNPDCAGRLELACSRDELRSLDPDGLRRHAWQAVVRQSHLRRIFAPAEAINALTIGGEHADGSQSYDARNRIDPYGVADGARLPSPITAFGGGVGRALKPDLHYPAGRQLYQESYSTAQSGVALDRARSTALPPGQRVAAPGTAPGRLDQTRYLCGTSNAAALMARTAAQLYDHLPELLGQPPGFLPERRYLVPLLKTLLVHDVSWGESRDLLMELSVGALASDPARMDMGRFLGYGFPGRDRLLGCHDQRATLCGWGELGDGEGHVFRIPLPPSLQGQRVWRRLTVTLAWLSPINPFDRRYRRAHLWFEPKAGAREPDTARLLEVRRCEADNRAALRGTVQHEIFEGERAAVFTEDYELVIKVSCRAHAGDLAESVPDALAVSLEVAPGVGVPIYEEMRVRLRPRAQIRPS